MWPHDKQHSKRVREKSTPRADQVLKLTDYHISRYVASTLLDRRVERSRTLLVEVGFIFMSRRTGAEWLDSVVGEGVPDPRTGKKGEK